MPKLKHWLMVAHPWSWPASGSPAMIAFSYVFYMYKTGVVAEVNWSFGILAIIGAVIFHAAGNLISEYHDYVSGVDKLEKTGPVRLIVLFEPKPVLLYGYLVLSAGILLGIYLLVNTGLPLLLVGIIGVVSATLYYKFKYAGMSDLIIFICYGMSIAFGVVYAMTTELVWPILLISTPVGMLIVAILHANNTRDMIQDKEAGIKTQAMKLGLEGSQIVYQTLLLVAYLVVAIAVMMRFLHPVVFVVLVTFPLAIKNIKLMKTATVDNLAKIQFLDTYTAKLVLMFSMLLSAANFIAPFV
jgi:1,4-dihydroxy-2-naphthoate octaprenyltransferase